MKIKVLFILIIALMLNSFSCSNQKNEEIKESKNKPKELNKFLYAETSVPKIINEWVHDSSSFTQGLFFLNDTLVESTGIRGHSHIKTIDYRKNKIIKKKYLPNMIFGEGSTIFKNKIYVLSYKAGKVFVLDRNLDEIIKTYNYFGEGWGISSDSSNLYMSDGTNSIRVLNEDFEIQSIINVKLNGSPLYNLNELEYVDGFLYANVWMQDYIVKIQPKTGEVVKKYDMSSLIQRVSYNPAIDVLNGIAYNGINNTFFITGKLWPLIFEVKLD